MNKKIFVSIAAYCEPFLELTITSLLANCSDPSRLTIGIADQSNADQKEFIKSLIGKAELRYVHVNPRDSLGASWARSLIQSLYSNEDYYLQIDSHTVFDEGWDITLSNSLDRVASEQKNEKIILSVYPYGFEIEDDAILKKGPKRGDTTLILRPKQTFENCGRAPILQFTPKHIYTKKDLIGCHVAGGFIFAPGSFVHEVPYDPYMYFHGEEQNLSLRAWTRGWDIVHPHYIPLYHLYKLPNKSYETHHWSGPYLGQRDISVANLQDRARKRLADLVSYKSVGLPYGLGYFRDIKDYAEKFGIDYLNSVVDEAFPYEKKTVQV